MVIQNNLLFINAQNQYKVSTGARAKTTEKLSSGYRINRAADDAAGLTISEKLRSQIRGLNRGTHNGQDGISWIQTGDGALNEVHSILHRMKELTVQALNDTNTEEDRAALQAEMDSLQSEIDRITDTTQFNEQNIFAGHEPVYYQYEGNAKWNQSQVHVINAGDNQMVINYSKDGSTSDQLVIEVPAGEYTTQELTDEIDDALNAMGVDGINVEYTDDGTFNVNFENGEKIEEITGGLARLLYDSYEGGSVGALIGTTSFPNDTIKMEISNDNNNLEFDIEYFDGRTTSVSVALTPGKYTRPELIDKLNESLDGTGVSAQAYGSGIKLGSNDAIITGFKGDMFKIDGGANPYTSIFYDNVKYGSISTTSAQFVGGTVIPNNSKDLEHQKFNITASNNELTFKSNGSDTSVTITIPQGEYTVEEMRDELNALFVANNLELNAIVHDDGSYKGITINSQVKGAVSEVGLSSSSSAYNTLFVKRVYNAYKTDAVETVENTANKQASFTGSKVMDGTNPLVITENNNEFEINMDGTKYTIKLDNGTYNTANDLCAEINDKLNGASALSGYKDKINAVSVNGKISLVTTSNSGIVNFEAAASGSDMGYDNIFVGKKQVVTQTSVSASASGKPEVTLNTAIPDPAYIAAGDNRLEFKLDGFLKVVTLPTGNVSHADIIDAINDQVKEYTSIIPTYFNTIDVQGTTQSYHFTATSVPGDTKVASKTYSNTGSSTIQEGTAGSSNNVAAKIKMDVAVPENMVIDNSNNTIQITINDNTEVIKLDNNTYSRSALVSELQKKIDNAFGTGEGGAVVSLSDNKLVFTARMEVSTNGRDTNISFSTGSSSFVKDLHTTETGGTATTKVLNNSITITESSKEFKFTYMEDGVSKTANITLDKGTYTRSGFVSMLNQKMTQEGINITASLSSNALKLETDSKGNDGNKINLSSQTLGNSVEALFGPMVVKTKAEGVTNKEIFNEITIDGTTDVFNIEVNGINYNFKLDHGVYDRDDFVDMLNNKMSGTGASVSLENNCLKFVTDEAGSDKSIYFHYVSGGSSVCAMFGSRTVDMPGVEASFNANNQLVITGSDNASTLEVSSTTGSIFMEPTVKTEDIDVTKQKGYYSSKYAQVDGVNVSSPIQIDEWNDELTFVYKENGNSHSISIDLQANTYTFADLQTALQDEIDRQVGSGEMTVDVSASGVVIKANNPGSNYSIPKSSFGGDFYYKVMCSTKETTSNRTPSVKNGSAPKDTAYTVGRKDIRSGSTEIKAGINDTLSLDFTYGNTTNTFTLKLDAGIYSGEELKDMIQEKLDDEVVKVGLSEGIIEVGIGGISTGVTGSNDANALNFKLSQSVRLPEDGTYIIDGVKGNAAFSIFYQTDGELEPAYVKGAKDVSEGVVIEAGKDTMSMDVEGTTYSITLTAGEYTSDDLLTEINNKLSAVGAPVTAELDLGGVIRFSHNKLGERQISNVTGSAKQTLFFNENGEIGEKKDIKIQLSSREGDYITIDRPVLNTVSLGINSIAITDPKYANKALTRIDKAVNQVSQIRSDFGAIQNRLEFSINSNKNNSENTQAAESLLRDADMADEITKLSKQQILIQAGEAMMAQANSLAEGVLRILNA